MAEDNYQVFVRRWNKVLQEAEYRMKIQNCVERCKAEKTLFKGLTS